MKPPNFGVEALDDAGNVVHYFATQADARRAGHCQPSISQCLRGKRLKHKGLTWRHATALSRLPQFVAANYRRPIYDLREVYRAYLETLPESWRRFADEPTAMRIIDD